MATTKLDKLTVRQYVRQSEIYEEYPANEQLFAGHLLQLRSDGNVEKHTTTGGKMVPLLATETLDVMQGGEISVPYDEGDWVSTIEPQQGDKVLVVLADGEDVAYGDFLDSNGGNEAGTVKKNNTGSWAQFQALESMDLTGSSGEESQAGPGADKWLLVKRVA